MRFDTAFPGRLVLLLGDGPRHDVCKRLYYLPAKEESEQYVHVDFVVHYRGVDALDELERRL
jgi:hypothetical protein